ncbi:hypothetical protein GUJ93_ZPchr0002g23591 [Zizania palustris]|uniref:Myb-like domain-containing protein n=1 Tax=Zizania palustris TaxID=103762 RepID=A0A8J5VVZ3_ZIZPA|nr:hypothetical protein GUJ93_ZPchr0002g23591 [Zizania palustris]
MTCDAISAPAMIRIQAICGFPLLAKDAEYVSKIADILGQLLASEENVERDAVHKALMSLIRQDAKNSLQPLFKHVESGSEIREQVICFLKDKVFPVKAELLKPQAEMERYITDLIKKSLSIFGDSAPRESFQELIEIIQAQADLDAQFNKVAIPEHTVDDNMDEDFVESSSPEQDNDSGNEYNDSGKQKLRGNLREKIINKEPLKGIKRTSRSKDSIIEESQKQKLQKNKSKASSGDQKKTSKDSSVEQSEKKLSHRIRQKRMKEVKTLLETPDHEIDPMKLSVTHLRLLQEARERIKGKEIPSGPSSFNRSSQFGDMDYEYNEQEIYDDDRVENHVLENATKLNYHSYMNKQARAKWSKSDTDLFYQGLRQFGSDFAMIQHLFPDKTRNQVRQKFKTEEKKHPMQVHDSIMHRSRDNLYFKKVIKQLNIKDVQPDNSNAHEQDGAPNEGDPGNKNMLGDFINEEEDNDSNWSDKELDMHVSEVEENDHVSTNADGDDLGDVFDWY